MSLKDQMAIDAKTVFINNGEFAEEITYTPAGGTAKIIRAVIVRKELLPSDEVNNRSLKNQAEVYVSTDPLEGISFINRRDDRITIDVEGTAKDARVNDILSKDEGMWHLLIGW